MGLSGSIYNHFTPASSSKYVTMIHALALGSATASFVAPPDGAPAALVQHGVTASKELDVVKV